MLLLWLIFGQKLVILVSGAAGLNIYALFGLKIGYEPKNVLKIEKLSIAHMACFRAEICVLSLKIGY